MSNLEKFCNKDCLNSRISFGQYMGMTINEIGEIDSDYILYLYKQKLIKPDEELKKILEDLNGYSTRRDSE